MTPAPPLPRRPRSACRKAGPCEVVFRGIADGREGGERGGSRQGSLDRKVLLGEQNQDNRIEISIWG